MCKTSFRFKQLLCALIFLLHSSFIVCVPVIPYYSPRSQGRNAALNDAGFFLDVFSQDPKPERIHGTIAITPAYTKSFDNNQITQRLFGPALQGCNDNRYLKVSGSAVENPGQFDLFADYFYLPPDFESSISFDPQVDNFLVNLQFFISLDCWMSGLYFYVYTPLVHTRWHLGMCEKIINPGSIDYEEGYFAEDTVYSSAMVESFTDYASGATITSVPNIVFQQLRSAQMSSRHLAKTRFSDILFAFGYNMFHTDSYGLGFALQGCAPTGTRPSGDFLFEPIIGNGHHWEIGAELYGYYKGLYTSDESMGIAAYFDITVSHQFSAKQYRTFDLKNNGCLSRYMLAQNMGTPVIDGLEGPTGTVPNGQFQNMFAPVANITTLAVHAHSAIQADIVLAIVATMCDFEWEIGYNFWGISKEHLSVIETTNPFMNNTTWALKGDAHVFGYEANSTTAVPLSATESKATVYSGTNILTQSTLLPEQNPEVDFAQTAYNGSGQLVYAQNVTNLPDGTNEILTSINPVFIKAQDINVEAARTGGYSNKIYTHFNYSWSCRQKYIPFIGFGGQVEWAPKNQAEKCNFCALSQWGLWLKGGFSFE